MDKLLGRRNRSGGIGEQVYHRIADQRVSPRIGVIKRTAFI